MKEGTLVKTKGAMVSHDRKYRYSLWRIWDDSKPLVLWIMHNPSTADADQDDPTIRRCIAFTKSWGYGGMYVGNLFPYRATNPADLKKLPIAELCPENNATQIRVMAVLCQLHILAYGNPIVDDMLPESTENLPWHYLKLTKADNPCHPLYLRKDLKPIKF